MKQDEVYAQIQSKKLWMFLAQINYNAATSPTSLTTLRDLCAEGIETLERLRDEIDQYMSDRLKERPAETRINVRVGKPVKAKIGECEDLH